MREDVEQIRQIWQIVVMPFADDDERRAYMRERYRWRLENEPGFKEKESLRRKIFYAVNLRYRKRVKASVRRQRAAKRKEGVAA
jgi:hypothetical protein